MRLIPRSDVRTAAPSVAGRVAEMAAIQEMQRIERMRQAWLTYYGEVQKPLRVTRAADGTTTDDNVVLNYPRLVVDKGVGFLFGADVQFELDGGSERTPAEEWLDAAWDANRKATLLHKLALNGGVCGHAWLKVRPAPVQGALPRLIVLDPQTVSVLWDPADFERVVEYRIAWHGTDPATGRAVAFRQIIAPDGAAWRIVDERSVGDAGWETLSEERWPWSWPPIIGCQNLPAPNEYFGVSDLDGGVTEICGAINRLLSNLARIIRFHAHPKTWSAGWMPQKGEIDARPDAILHLPTGATLHNLEMQSDLGSSIQLYLKLKEALHELTRIPEVATGKVEDAGALSGVALRILYQPLLEKTATKRLLYGDLLVELNRRLLEMGGWGADQRTELHWPELLPADPRAEAETALLWQQVGVSRATLLERGGFDPDLEETKREEEATARAERAAAAFDRGGLPEGQTGDGGPGTGNGQAD